MDSPYPIGMVEEIEKFLAGDHFRTQGQDLYPDVFDTAMMFPLQRQEETRQMMREARYYRDNYRSPQVIYEIGTDKAGGLYHWCKGFPSVEKVIACEIRGTPYAKAFQKAFPRIEFLWIEGSSYDQDAIRRVAQFIHPLQIDVLFIDGDKSHFLTDFDSYRPMMSNSGIIFMHDVTDPAPGEAYAKVKARGYQCREIIDKTDTYVARFRESQGIPSKNPHEDWLRYWKGASCGVGVIPMGSEYRGGL